MTSRQVIVLGTASQVPTRTRAHNGLVVRWDDLLLLFDPGEGTQRQCTLAGVAVAPLDAVADLAEQHGHLTAGQAARLASDAGVRRLVLTHFSGHYPDESVFEREASAVHADVVAASDLAVIDVPPAEQPVVTLSPSPGQDAVR